MKQSISIAELKAKTINSAKWNIPGQISVQLLNIFGTIILSRLLPPEDFGALIMLTLVSSYAGLVMNNVVANAVTQSQVLNKLDYSSIFWTSIIAGVIFSALLILFRNSLTGFYNQPMLSGYINIFSLIFIFYAIGSVPQALLIKQHNFKQVVIGNIIAIVISYVVAIIMVMMHYRVFSLVMQILLNVVISSLYYFWAARWKPFFALKWNSLKKVKNFSIHLFLNTTLEYFAFNLDSFLVGRSFGRKDLGLYGRSKQLVFLPVQNVAFAISRSFYPAFAQMQSHKDELRLLYLSALRVTFFITATIITYMVVVAPDLIEILMGEQWIGMVVMFQLFSITGILGILNGFNDSFISSQGRTDLLFKVGLFEKSFSLASTIIGLQYGIKGVIYARLIAAFVILIPKVFLLLYVVKLDLKSFIGNILKIIIINIILLSVCWLFMMQLNTMNMYLRFTIVTVTFGASALALSILFKEKGYYALLNLVKKTIWKTND